MKIIPHRTLSKTPEGTRQRTDSEEKPVRHSLPIALLTATSDRLSFIVLQKSANRNSWFKSIALSFTTGGGSPRTESARPSPLDAPTHVRRRALSLLDPKVFTSRTAGAEDPRLPEHMKRRELKLRRTQRRDPPASKVLPDRRSSVDRSQKYPPWWPI